MENKTVNTTMAIFQEYITFFKDLVPYVKQMKDSQDKFKLIEMMNEAVERITKLQDSLQLHGREKQ